MKFLYYLFAIVVAIGVIALSVGAIWLFLSVFQSYPIIIAIVLIVGINVIFYFASYVNERISKFYFWLGLFLSILFVLLPFWGS